MSKLARKHNKQMTSFAPNALSILLAIVAVVLLAYILVHRDRSSDDVRAGAKRTEAIVAKPVPVKAVAVKSTSDAMPVDRNMSETSKTETETSDNAKGGSVDSDDTELSLNAVEALESEMQAIPPVSAETLAAIRNAFAVWRATDQGEQATADLRMALSEFSKEETLAAASNLMRLGSTQDKMDALWAIASEFGVDPNKEPLGRANASDGESPPAAPEYFGDAVGDADSVIGGGEDSGDAAYEEELTREAKETASIIDVVSSGLEDDNSDVRDCAYEIVSTLSPERSDALWSQLLCSDSEVSADLRERLMKDIAGRTDEGAVSLNVMAYQSPDAKTASDGRKNLESISGLTLSSLDAVAEWLESKEQSSPDIAKDVDGKTTTKETQHE